MCSRKAWLSSHAIIVQGNISVAFEALAQMPALVNVDFTNNKNLIGSWLGNLTYSSGVSNPCWRKYRDSATAGVGVNTRRIAVGKLTSTYVDCCMPGKMLLQVFPICSEATIYAKLGAPKHQNAYRKRIVARRVVCWQATPDCRENEPQREKGDVSNAADLTYEPHSFTCLQAPICKLAASGLATLALGATGIAGSEFPPCLLGPLSTLEELHIGAAGPPHVCAVVHTTAHIKNCSGSD